MRVEPVVTVFGESAESGSFLDLVRDPETGKWLEYRSPDEHAQNEFQRLIKIAHPEEPAGVSIVLAVLDTGVIHSHPTILGLPITDVDFTGEGPEDLSGHGTVVTLILLEGYADVDVHLMNVKVAKKDGRGSPENLVKGLNWVTSYQGQHPEQRVFVNVSAGVYNRRLFGVLPCDGTCAVCTAARHAADAGILVAAAAGNTKGKTACPAMAALKFPDSAIVAVALAGYEDSGYGTVAIDVEKLARPVPIEAETPGMIGLAGEEADRYALQLGDKLRDAGDIDQAEKAYRHAAATGHTALTRAKASLSLGLLLATSGRSVDSEQWLREAAKLGDDPDVRAQALYALGRVTWELGRPDAADQLAAAVATQHAHFSPLSAHFLAINLLEAHRENEARSYLDIAVGSDDDEVACSARYNRARIRRNRGELDGAGDDYMAVAQKPSNVQYKAALGLGGLLAGQGELHKAAKWLEFASTAEDGHVAALAELASGDIAKAAGNLELARSFYLRASSRNEADVSEIVQSRLNEIGE